MKKVLCALLILTALLALTCTALAADVTAAYDDGQLTVSTSTQGYFRIEVDGAGTLRSLTPSVPTLTFEYDLSDGVHQVAISSDIAGYGSAALYVVNGESVSEAEYQAAQPTPTPVIEPTAAPTATPTAAPVIDPTAAPVVQPTAAPAADPTASPESVPTAEPVPTPAPATDENGHQHTPEIVAPAVDPTCAQAGQTAEERCAVCGELLQARETVPALGHRYVLTSRENGRASYRCSRCGDTKTVGITEAIQNRLGNGLLMDAKGAYVDYTARPDSGDANVLVITAEPGADSASEIGLYVDTALIMQMMREGFTVIEYVNGGADLRIALNSVTPSWFDGRPAIVCYVFVTDPLAADGPALQVKGRTAAGELIDATQFDGVALAE